MKTCFRWCWVLGLGLLGCGRTPTPARTPQSAEPRYFETRGVVREIAPDRRRAVIRHEEIPGYMPKMTMELNVRDPQELREITAGDEITFRLWANSETHWIDNIRRVGRSTAAVPGEPLFVPEEVPLLQPGESVPDVEFLSETGQKVRLSDFRGRALALTFFFTRCPLPDYCPRMNSQFRQARELLKVRDPAAAQWQLLSISFDAAFDRPGILASYARGYRGDDTAGWLFVAAAPETLTRLAPRFDLMVMRDDGGGFSHNLRTAVLDRQGRLVRTFEGNEWTAAQLAEAVWEAARSDSTP